ncbi:7,8 dihydropteroate synthase (methanopterin) [Arcticibacter svalbardensis MN12-7]|uniref:7,8 dihydropteroate synthase (Methanopterin) n=1 Tax=Arcticibacter svalbardensis MN12-7 TaxID=1150600 RepID=R9GWN7_9SPHI|nr:MBL fold metallo-hydrolase [Arcticibacter svalbardensis]EOR93374.1 7,8 dihydropteroate synthase (methanopterin) [Arcticibacter svalbardensis MN12-7]
MRIVTLIENMTDRSGLLAEHGLSFYIESENKKILFDCGQTAVFLKNAKQLGISITEVDALVLSHGHYDHTGGLKYFLQENDHAPIYLKREALLKKYHGERYIGIDAALLSSSERVHYIDHLTELDEGLFIVPEIKIHYPHDVHFHDMSIVDEQGRYPDTFEDELFLTLINNGKLTIVSSCSHRGISNIIKSASDLFHLPVQRVIGGLHLKNAKTADAENISAYFNEMNIDDIFVCHCTGIDSYVILKNQCKGHVFYNQTGREIFL